MIIIRPEKKEDIKKIRQLNDKAFGQTNEGSLVDALRKDNALLVSLVAEKDQRIVGHIAFSPVDVVTANLGSKVLGLGPMAVLPEYQRSGIGSKLMESGLEECKNAGWNAVVVLGHPDFYPRFGFVPSIDFKIKCCYDVPDDVFMAVELEENALDKVKGTAQYHPAFEIV